MAHEGPSSLPSFYSEKMPEGRVVKHPSDEEELLASPGMTGREKAPDTGRDSASEPPSGASQARWSLDDARREEYWKGYWDRKRMERDMDRESHWYPEYRGPMRYIEYPDNDPSPRAVFRQPSRRETRPPPPRPSSRVSRNLDEDLPPKRPVETYDEEYVEMIYPEGRGRRRGPPPVPPPRPSIDEDSTGMRLPFLSWMGNTVKGRTFLSTLNFESFPLLINFRFCGSFGRVCRYDHVSLLCICWDPGMSHSRSCPIRFGRMLTWLFRLLMLVGEITKVLPQVEKPASALRYSYTSHSFLGSPLWSMFGSSFVSVEDCSIQL
jgi:hypothetical protein